MAEWWGKTGFDRGDIEKLQTGATRALGGDLDFNQKQRLYANQLLKMKAEEQLLPAKAVAEQIKYLRDIKPYNPSEAELVSGGGFGMELLKKAESAAEDLYKSDPLREYEEASGKYQVTAPELTLQKEISDEAQRAGRGQKQKMDLRVKPDQGRAQFYEQFGLPVPPAYAQGGGMIDRAPAGEAPVPQEQIPQQVSPEAMSIIDPRFAAQYAKKITMDDLVGTRAFEAGKAGIGYNTQLAIKGLADYSKTAQKSLDRKQRLAENIGDLNELMMKETNSAKKTELALAMKYYFEQMGAANRLAVASARASGNEARAKNFVLQNDLSIMGKLAGTYPTASVFDRPAILQGAYSALSPDGQAELLMKYERELRPLVGESRIIVPPGFDINRWKYSSSGRELYPKKTVTTKSPAVSGVKTAPAAPKKSSAFDTLMKNMDAVSQHASEYKKKGK